MSFVIVTLILHLISPLSIYILFLSNHIQTNIYTSPIIQNQFTTNQSHFNYQIHYLKQIIFIIRSITLLNQYLYSKPFRNHNQQSFYYITFYQIISNIKMRLKQNNNIRRNHPYTSKSTRSKYYRLEQVLQISSAQEDSFQQFIDTNKNSLNFFNNIVNQKKQKATTIKKINQLKVQYEIENIFKESSNKNDGQYCLDYYLDILEHLKLKEQASLIINVKQIKLGFSDQRFQDIRAKYIDIIQNICHILRYQNSEFSAVWIFDKLISFKIEKELQKQSNSIQQLEKITFDKYFLTALIIAFKYCEIYPPNISQLLNCLNSNINIQQIIKQQAQFLLNINFKIIKPNQKDFLDLILLILKPIFNINRIHYEFLLQIGLINLDLCYQKPSLKAIGVIYFSSYFLKMKQQDRYPQILRRIFRYRESDLKRIGKIYLKIFIYLEKNNFLSILENSECKYRGLSEIYIYNRQFWNKYNNNFGNILYETKKDNNSYPTQS